jgi:hypothetical protein
VRVRFGGRAAGLAMAVEVTCLPIKNHRATAGDLDVRRRGMR